MLRIVSIVDKENTALDRLAKGVAPYHNNLDYHVVAVHPKRPDSNQLQRFEELARTADIIDAQYYRTIEMLRSRYEWLKEIPTILTHNNPYSITESDWNSYQVVVGNNKSIYERLKDLTISRVEYIPITVDPYFWSFEEYKFNKSIIMVANRIESKKGILPVAKACQELGIKMRLVGAISDPDYWQEVMATGVVEFAQEITDEQLRDLYHDSGLLICNSVNNFESGTMPILEAMFCGIPVLTRPIGHVPDIKSEDNLIINHGDPEDVNNLINLIEEAFADLTIISGANGGKYNLNDNKRSKIHSRLHNAWLSIKDRNFERRAYMYQKLYRELTEGEPVSVVVPVSDKPQVTSQCLNALLEQTHKNLEIIVVDDGTEEQPIESIRRMASIPIRYIKLNKSGYNLAEARNRGAIEATSDILIFCDQRQVTEPNAIEEFLKEIRPHAWLYGNKGAKKDFVENFSMIYRDDFFTLGMFNERCQRYGALSQETRARARRQGFDLKYVESARANPASKSSNRWQKKIEIMESKNMLWKMGML